MLSKFVRNSILPAAALFCGAAAHAATPVNQCGQKLNVAGESYYFTANLNCASGPAVMVMADNVRLDLKGFTLSGGGTGTAIMSTNGAACVAPKNVEISNGTIMSFGTGVGICVPNGVITETRWNVHHLSIRGIGSGIRVLYGSNNDIHHNTIERATLDGAALGNGIEVFYGNYNLIRSNVVSFSRLSGIYINGLSNWNSVGLNTLMSNATGVKVANGVKDTVVRSNSATANTAMDLEDANTSCGNNDWLRNIYNMASKPCIK